MLTRRGTRKIFAFWICSSVWGGLLIATSNGWAEDYATTWTGKVVGVKDGDSVIINRLGKRVTIRLLGVDAPEYEQPWGQQAKAFTHQQVFGKKVTVLEKEKDQYGRNVATVRLPDGSSLNQRLVRQGLAWWYRHYSKDKILKKLEQEARRNRIGLWSEPKPMPPWIWRHKHPRRRR